MKFFETPVVEIQKFDLEDVIATSTDTCDTEVTECGSDGCDWDGGDF